MGAPLFYPSGTVTNAGLLRVDSDKSVYVDERWLAKVDGAVVSKGHHTRRAAIAAAVEALREKTNKATGE